MFTYVVPKFPAANVKASVEFYNPHSAPNRCPDSIFPRKGRGGEGFGDGQAEG